MWTARCNNFITDIRDAGYDPKLTIEPCISDLDIPIHMTSVPSEPQLKSNIDKSFKIYI